MQTLILAVAKEFGLSWTVIGFGFWFLFTTVGAVVTVGALTSMYFDTTLVYVVIGTLLLTFSFK